MSSDKNVKRCFLSLSIFCNQRTHCTRCFVQSICGWQVRIRSQTNRPSFKTFTVDTGSFLWQFHRFVSKQLHFLINYGRQGKSLFVFRSIQFQTMIRHPTTDWYDELSLHYEHTRFAMMFILFTLFAFLITILLLIYTKHTQQNQSSDGSSSFLPHYVLLTISISFLCIFLIGSLVYTRKSLRTVSPHSIVSIEQDNV